MHDNTMRRVKVKQMGGSDFEIVVPKDVSKMIIEKKIF